MLYQMFLKKHPQSKNSKQFSQWIGVNTFEQILFGTRDVLQRTELTTKTITKNVKSNVLNQIFHRLKLKRSSVPS